MNNRLGCLTGSGIIAALLTTLIVTGITLVQGGVLFNPGPLNAQAGEALGGIHSHAELANQCKACHTAFWEADKMADRCVACHTAISIELADPQSLHGVVTRNYSNLACRDCHTDHNGPDGSLTNMDVNRFPHEALGYSLNGHQRLGSGAMFQCGDCHSDNHYSPFDPSVCETCHRQLDATFTVAHTLTFGKDCLACHDGVDTYGEDFDHDTFPFPLTGKHVDADCSQCHLSARSIPDLQAAPVDCFSCHAEDDPHQGRFGPDCAACHTPAGWIPAQFDHSLAAFKLEGEHTDVACEDCHQDGIYKGTPSDCFSCHAADDEHEGSLGTDCAKCHSPAGWEPAMFDHNLADFKLEGKHADIACENCHENGVFKGTPSDCFSCHAAEDPHAGRFGTDCAACHSPTGWKPALFDHNLAAFKLTGKHVDAACEDCHQNGIYKGTPTDCYSCHAGDDDHNGQFGTACNACHSTFGWLPTSFDHSLSSFPLTGAHVSVACTRCHINNVFRGTSSVCVSCHGDPPFHAGLFGTICSQCHTTSAWIPATFNRSHPFPVNHENASTCRDCHTISLSAWTCYTCHNQAEMQDKHKDMGDFSNCLTCHPTGQKEGGGD
jgi:hypothetical protein